MTAVTMTVMPTHLRVVRRTAIAATLTPLAIRVRGEYREMPGLRLNIQQAARLFGVAADVAGAVLDELRHATILARSDDGFFAAVSEPTRRPAPRPFPSEAKSEVTVTAPIDAERGLDGELREASLDRLLCLQRHWAWADEAMARFDHQLANGLDYDDDPMSDHPFGAYYHWCALLCGFAEAAIDRGLLSPPQLEPIRQDIEAGLPGLRACRRLLVTIPASLKEHPRVADLLQDRETLARLRRLHESFGEVLRQEQMAREMDLLDQ